MIDWGLIHSNFSGKSRCSGCWNGSSGCCSRRWAGNPAGTLRRRRRRQRHRRSCHRHRRRRHCRPAAPPLRRFLELPHPALPALPALPAPLSQVGFITFFVYEWKKLLGIFEGCSESWKCISSIPKESWNSCMILENTRNPSGILQRILKNPKNPKMILKNP